MSAALVWTHWLSERTFYGPAIRQTLTQARCIYLQPARPLGDCQKFSVALQKSVASKVLHLFEACRPAAVRFRVRPVVIFPFQCFSARTWPHVAVKLSEVMQPRWIDCDASASIVFVAFKIWIQTAIASASPRAIFRRVTASVAKIAFGSLGISSAAAALAFANGQIMREDFFRLTADATTSHVSLIIPARRFADHCPVSIGCSNLHTMTISQRKTWHS